MGCHLGGVVSTLILTETSSAYASSLKSERLRHGRNRTGDPPLPPNTLRPSGSSVGQRQPGSPLRALRHCLLSLAHTPHPAPQ